MSEIIRKHILSFTLSTLAFILIIAAWAWALISLKGISRPIITHFNAYDGINRIGSLGDLTAIAATALIIVALNALLSYEFEKRDVFMGRLIASGNLLLGILIFIGFAAIVSVN